MNILQRLNPFLAFQSIGLKAGFFLLLLTHHLVANAQYHSSKINIGIIYPLSSNGRNAPLDSNDLSINLLAGVSAVERGLSFAGITNVVRYNAYGAQFAGFSNHILKKSKGALFAGFVNTYAEGDGIAFAGFSNIAYVNLKGAQFAGFANVAKNVTGLQFAGFGNISGKVKGTQFSGFINKASAISDSQFAGFINIAKDVNGSQFAGFINVAKKVRGTQIAGFVNIAEESDCPIGILNFIKNGEKSIGVSIDENETAMLTFRSGGKTLYGILAAGYNFKNEAEVYAFEAGFGAHFFQSRSFRINTELTASTVESFKDGEYFRASFKLFPAIKLFKHLEIVAGPGLSFTSTNTSEGLALNANGKNISTWQNKRSDYTQSLALGYSVGLHVLF